MTVFETDDVRGLLDRIDELEADAAARDATKRRVRYEVGEGWSVAGMCVSGEHAEVFDIWSPATDKRRLCLCVCAVCGKTWNEGAMGDDYPKDCATLSDTADDPELDTETENAA